MLLISFPHNPTTTCVDLAFLTEIVELARESRHAHRPRFRLRRSRFRRLQAAEHPAGARAPRIAVEIFSMSKSYNMAGWRVGFCLGNRKLIAALARIKSYLDYGIFQPVQIASIIALRECEDEPRKICQIYRTGAMCWSMA